MLQSVFDFFLELLLPITNEISDTLVLCFIIFILLLPVSWEYLGDYLLEEDLQES